MNPTSPWSDFERIYLIYQKKYDFHFCGISEIEKVKEFIDCYWKKEHVFTKSQALLDWQHLDKRNSRYDFVVATDRESREIHAIVGFIMSSRYDEKIEHPIRWGAIWKVREDVGIKGVGLSLKYFFEKNVPADYIGGVGLSEYSKAINRKLGENVGKLKQFYMLNKAYETFRLIDNFSAQNLRGEDFDKGSKLRKIDGEKLLNERADYYVEMPQYKSPLYYVNRYARHPVYQYHFLEIVDSAQKAMACIIWRKCEANGSAAIMIVDYIGTGEELTGLYSEFQELMQEHGAEYICFCEYGLKDSDLEAAGFLNRENSEIVIPVYYEPFTKKNIDLDYHFYSNRGYQEEKVRIFKGDADQDRPNQL